MLVELRVENYAVIDQAAAEFAPGLNLLTGETGAGKSILIDALSLLLGERASSDVIRHGTEKAVVSCVFDLDAAALDRADDILQGDGIDIDGEDQRLILKREILANGKGRVFVNNQPATVAVLKALSPVLASIHAQNETIHAFDAGVRLAMLDRFAQVETDDVQAAFRRVSGFKQQIEELERSEQDRLKLVDLWSFQKKEIDAAKLQPGEDTRLETEKRVLANSEKLYAAAMGTYEALYEGEVNALALVRSAERHVEELGRYDEKFQQHAATLASAYATLADVSADMLSYAGSISASPERLAQVEDRLALIDRLKKKYGHTIEDVITYGDEVTVKLHEIENRDAVLAELHKDLNAAAQGFVTAARVISKKRRTAAEKLQRLVEAEINDLAMKAKFSIEVSGDGAEENWSGTGFDSVEYLIATNVGDPMSPIAAIASGGEMSRVMLALKTAIETASDSKKKRQAEQKTLVFDEIDIGIGGRAAEAVGKKLKTLAQNHQVLCITHLPQIASFADHHLVVEKRESGGQTRTSVRALSAAERTEEVARMLSGANLTETSIKHAEQMLKTNA